MPVLKNPFAVNPLGEPRSPQQEEIFNRFFSDKKRHAVIHGPSCGASIAALALGVANILEKGRDTLLVAPTQYQAVQSVSEEFINAVVCKGNAIVARDTGVTLRIHNYNSFIKDSVTAGIEPGTMDLLIDGTWAYMDEVPALFRAIDTMQPGRMMSFDRAYSYSFGPDMPHPVIAYANRYGCEFVHLSSLESPLLTADELQVIRGDAIRRGYHVDKYLAGEMF